MPVAGRNDAAIRSITATPDFMSLEPQPCRIVAVASRRNVVCDRHGVEVSCEHNALRSAGIASSQHDVAVPLHMEVVELT